MAGKIYRPTGPGLGQSLEQRSETQNLYEAINALSRRIAELEGKLAREGAGQGTAPVSVVQGVASSGVVLSDVTPAEEIIGTGGAAGGAEEAARADHIHPFPESAAAVDLGDANADGTAVTIARSDHVHKRTTRVKKGGSDVGTRNAVNLIDGVDVTHTVSDNAGQDQVDVTGALTDTGVSAGMYGDTTHYPIVTVDAKGRVTSASEQTVASDDHKVLNTSADTTAGYLNDKLAVTAPLTKTTNNAGANETLGLAVSAASTSAAGVVVLATPSSDTTAGHVVQASDARLSDARTPTGSAGGDLSGTFPNPTLNTVGVVKGGTGKTSLTAYGLLAAGTTSTGALQQIGVGSAGQILRSGGASALAAFSTATYPDTAGTSGNVLTSDGTDFVSQAWATGLPVGTDTQMLYNSSGTWAATSQFTFDGNTPTISNINTTASVYHGKSCRASLGSPSATGQNDVLGGFDGAGNTGSLYSTQARVYAGAQGTWSGTARGAFVDVQVTDASDTSHAMGTSVRFNHNGRTGFQTTAPKTTVHINGGVAFGVASKSANYTGTEADEWLIVARASTPNVITLPPATNAGQQITVTATGSTGAVTIQRAGADTIETSGAASATSISIAVSNSSRILRADGASKWYVVAST